MPNRPVLMQKMTEPNQGKFLPVLFLQIGTDADHYICTVFHPYYILYKQYLFLPLPCCTCCCSWIFTHQKIHCTLSFNLGLGLSLAPIGAYLAVTGTFGSLPLFFSACVLMWVSGFDIIYALQDEEFDKENKLFSIPAAFGKKNALRIFKCCTHRLSHLYSGCRCFRFIWYVVLDGNSDFYCIAGIPAFFG